MELKPNSMSTQQRLHYIRMSEAVLAKNPNNVDALVNIGMLLMQERKWQSAIDSLKKGLTKRKKDERIMNALGKCYFESANYLQANKIRRKLTELFPRNLNYLADYAESLQHAGKIDSSTKIYDKLEKLAPDNADVVYKKASQLRAQGKYDQANKLLVQIQQLQPGHPESLYLYCNSKKFTQGETTEYIGHIESALNNTSDVVDICNLNYGAGKILHDIGKFDEAIAYFKAANDLRTSEINHNFVTPFNNLKSVFTKKYLQDRHNQAKIEGKPLFILGMPRSGTTLIESLCGAHPQIVAGDEMIFMSSMLKKLGMESNASDFFHKSMNEYSEANFNQMARDYIDFARNNVKTTGYFTDKLPHNFMCVGMIRLLFPNTKIIHCRRHPIDNCLSLYSNSMRSVHIAYKSDLTTLGLYYRQYWQLMQHWRNITNNGFHEVFYEDLVVNTELNARSMMEYLDLEWEESVLNRKGSQKSIKTLSSWQARQPIYKTSSGKWRNYEKHLQPLIDALGPVINDYESELAALQS